MAGLSQRQGASTSTEELFIKCALQSRDLRANGGLGDVEFFRRLPQAALFGDHPEVTKVMVIQEFHVEMVFVLT
jgi:hypothetical protein